MMAKITFAVIGAGNLLSAIAMSAYMLAADDLMLMPSLIGLSNLVGAFVIACFLENLETDQLADDSAGYGAEPDCRTTALVDQIHNGGTTP
jgi:hypothetical protein